MRNMIQPFMTVIEKVAKLISFENKVNVVFQGKQACTDGKTIYLPAMSDFSEETTADAHGFCDHETAHIKFTDFGQLEKVKKGKGEAFTRLLLNWLEDPRVEALQMKDLPGTKLNLKPMNTKYRAINLQSYDKQPWPMRLIYTLRDMYDGNAAPNDEEVAGIVKNLSAEFAVAKAATDTQGIRLACEGIRAKVLKLLEEEQKKQPKQPKGPKGQGPKGTEEGEGGAGQDWRDQEEEEGQGSGGEEGEEGGEEGEGQGSGGDGEEEGKGKEGKGKEKEGKTGKGKRGKGNAKPKASTVTKVTRDSYADSLMDADADWSGVQTATPAELAGESIEQEAESLLNKAAKAGKHIVFSTKNDQLNDFAGKGDAVEYNKLRHEVRNSTNSIKNTLERQLKVIENAKWVAERQTGQINTAALRNLATNRNYRTPFKEMRRTETNNVAVSILVDQSGSMSENNKINVAQQTAIAMGEALQELGIPFEVVGWYSEGDYELAKAWKDAGSPREFNRTGEHLCRNIFKGFGDTSCSGITRMVCGGHNPDGEAVRWAAGRLYDQRQKRKILFVLSDGQPNSVTGANDIVAQDLLDAVKQTEQLGIETIGIGICTDAPKHYYKLHAIVRNLQELPKVALRELATLLTQSRKAA